MSETGREFVSTESDEEDDADDEGETGCDDQEGSKLVEVPVGVVSATVSTGTDQTKGTIDINALVDIVVLEEDVACASD